MPRERSLDEFVDAGGTESDGPDGSDGSTDCEDPDEPDDPDAPANLDESDDLPDPDPSEMSDEPVASEAPADAADGAPPTEAVGSIDDVPPATPTYDWTHDGAACANCDETVEERWHGEAGLVCGDCKEW